jgi:PPOX class probable F420-dependent enzyme
MAELTEKARSLVDGPNLAFLATVCDDGAPQVSPVWIDRAGDTLQVNTAVGRVKDRNMRREPRVAISIASASEEDPYERVNIRGRVVEIDESDEANAHVDRLTRKYTDHESYPWHKPNERRVVFRIAPEQVGR